VPEADIQRLQTAEMGFPIPVTGYTLLDQARNEDIRNELGSYSTSERLVKKEELA
jgi:hypothetical protein